MKLKNIFSSLVITACIILSNVAYADLTSAVGYWKTVDDKTGQVLSVVQFYPADNNTLSGKIVKIMPIPGQKVTDICEKCKGDLKNKPILGMTIITGMTPVSADSWDHGQALDPKSGKVYQAKMHLEGGGQYLKLRGYIGFPLLGRTETWIRTTRP